MSAITVGIQFIGTIIILIGSFMFARKIGIERGSNGREVRGLIMGSIIFVVVGYTGIYIFASISGHIQKVISAL